ncbi:10629_t:CDS:10 [Paraglomus brasilianum]|uniref:10629_t:CDS:1 n=1 Tax=Paraglomus brasilianum TaxID=144538 RepID=A0A9N9ARV4_9GLOM|nr:10629_t:CDS:10 [Paraglomus brasilianum]
MGKSYLRYEPLKTLGIICSSSSNTIYDASGKLAVSPALEDIIIWDLKKGIQISKLHNADNESAVTSILRSPNNQDYAVGYSDGSIRIWNSTNFTTSLNFNGHRGAVTALAFDATGTRLASGSKDNDLIIWDIVGEVGLYRMRGHKDQITAVKFLSGNNDTSYGFLLSSSKDTLLKVWDLSTQRCVETVVAHRTEIWDFDISSDQTLLVTGSSEPGLKIWRIDRELLDKGLDGLVGDGDIEDGIKTTKKSIIFYGDVQRQSQERVITIKFHPSANILAVQGADKFIEIFYLRAADEIKRKIARRRKREKAKQTKTGEIADPDEEVTITASDEISHYQTLITTAKVRSFDFSPGDDAMKTGIVHVLASLTNNTLEVYSMAIPKKKSKAPKESNRLHTIELPGHRNDVRTLAISSDDGMLCSASKDTLKVWNVKTSSCIRSMSCGYALCSAFLPGDRHILLGTKSGELELFDLASSSLIESIKAHEGPIWSLQVRPDRKGVVTGSADKQVKFWDFDLVENEKASGPRRLTLVHMRTLKMTDDILCVRYSPDQKFIAVALLDSTVKVFYHDTLKFFLSLYGHKLPVLSMDISFDNKLLVTASADKNVKIWGLDFGDCHRSIFAHQDSIMSILFAPDSHYFFTASKDKFIKYWDGDKFENIMKLEGHHGEVWSLAISKRGDFIVSSSHDRSIRIWEQTDEPLFLEEEREKEMEEMYEATLTASMEKTSLNDSTVEVSTAGKQTMETLKAGERIIEAIEIADEDKAVWEEYNQRRETCMHPGPPPTRNPILVALGNLTGDQYLLRIVEKVRSTELEESLLVLPFGKVISLLSYLDSWAKKEWNIPLTCRILFYLLRVHHDQIVANRLLRPMLGSIRTYLRAALQRQKDMLGYNIAALKYVKREYEANTTAEFFDEQKIDEIKNAALKKRKFITLAT